MGNEEDRRRKRERERERIDKNRYDAYLVDRAWTETRETEKFVKKKHQEYWDDYDRRHPPGRVGGASGDTYTGAASDGEVAGSSWRGNLNDPLSYEVLAGAEGDRPSLRSSAAQAAKATGAIVAAACVVIAVWQFLRKQKRTPPR